MLVFIIQLLVIVYSRSGYNSIISDINLL